VIELRGYQQDCIMRIRDALRRCRRVLLQSPTGSGKTIMFVWLAMAIAAHGARVLILGHRQEIVDQVSAALTAFSVEHGIIAAGHAETAAPVQIASVMTLVRRLDHYRDTIDLVVVDEAHHSAAATWQRVLATYPNALILGVSATPERLDGKPLNDLYRELVIGPTVTELVRLGFLSPAVTFAPPVSLDLSGIRKRAGDYELDAPASRMSSAVLIGNAVEHYRQLSPQLPGLAYGVSIAHSKMVAEAFSGAGYAAVHVDGETPPDDRVVDPAPSF
jgi:DNA repair protein RadD